MSAQICVKFIELVISNIRLIYFVIISILIWWIHFHSLCRSSSHTTARNGCFDQKVAFQHRSIAREPLKIWKIRFNLGTNHEMKEQNFCSGTCGHIFPILLCFISSWEHPMLGFRRYGWFWPYVAVGKRRRGDNSEDLCGWGVWYWIELICLTLLMNN